MTKDEALKLALETLECWQRNEDCNEPMSKILEAIKEALAQPEQEPVPVKRMMEWVEGLKRQSDNGRYMHIPSGLNSGTCWELANELEQFIYTTPPQRTWVGLTKNEVELLSYLAEGNTWIAIELAEAKLKEKNT